MSIVNFRIKDPDREFYFLGDHILEHITYTPIEISDLSILVMDNVLKSMDAEIIEADITAQELRDLINNETNDLTIVPDILARDALTPAVDEVVLVQDIGNGTWAKYQWTGIEYVLIEAEGSNVIPDLVTLGDVNIVAQGPTEDGYAVRWDDTSSKFILSADVGGSSLTASEIKSLYESNADTNEFSNAEQSKLVGIEPAAKDDQSAIEVPFTPAGSIASTNVQLAIQEINLEKADIVHDHDLDYSSITHNHDLDYSAILHDHDSDYAPLVHTHAQYSLTTHDHDLAYSDISHDHDLDYSAILHNHDTDYAALVHNHDLDYSDISHDHNLTYEQLFGNPIVDGYVLTRDINGTTYWTAPAVGGGSPEINDAVTTLELTWSSTKIDGLFSGKSDTSHNHDADYSDILHDHDLDYATLAHTHTEYALVAHNHDLDYSDILHNHDSDYAALVHNHDLTYEQLFGNPLVDGQTLTRDINGTTYWTTPAGGGGDVEVNDGVTSLVLTWSSTKLTAELADKSETTHDHDLDYAAIAHTHDDRYYTETESDAKYSLLTHNHDLDYSDITHDHDSDYAPLVHDHDLVYAAIIHNHNADYAPLVHNHDLDYADISHDHDLDYAAIVHTHDGLLPAGGTIGQIATKNSGTDYDYSWADAPAGGGGGNGNTTVDDFIVELGAGATVADRIIAATTIPAGWTVAGADTAGVGNFGSSADTLVMIHSLGKVVVNMHIWEEVDAGPALVQGFTKPDLSSQGVQKNALDKNSCAIIGLQPLTTSSRPLYIHVQLG
jgi:hypothetical protein